jgi:hypothetical protein
MSGLWRRAKPYLPWVSLTVGVLSGLLMNRSPERAWLVVGAAAGAWFLVMALAVLGTLDPERLPALHGRLVKLGLASAPLATQSLVQLALFFAFPFYARAATWTAGHALFLGALAAAGALTLWDPAFAWVFGRRPGRLALVALASFAGLACVLPVLGLANQLSLVLAALFTAAGVPLLDVLESPRGEVSDWPRRARRWLARGLVAGVVLALTWGLGGPLVPPAPLSLGGMAVGTRLGDRWGGRSRGALHRAEPAHLRHRHPSPPGLARCVAPRVVARRGSGGRHRPRGPGRPGGGVPDLVHQAQPGPAPRGTLALPGGHRGGAGPGPGEVRGGVRSLA